jgi:primosomal protein N' (replication factor Y)
MFCKVAFNVPLDREFDYSVPEELTGKLAAGMRITAPFGPRLTGGIVTAVSDVCTAPENVKLKPISSVPDDRPLFGADLFPLAQFIKNHWGCPIGQILFSLVPPYPNFKLSASITPFNLTLKSPAFGLTAEQEKTLNILRARKENFSAPVLLSGNAFTGKTEIILRLTRETLSEYGQTLLLVPDIVSARHFIRQAQEHFGSENVFCWHSRTLISERKKIYSAISSGRPCVVIATRSGVLLPFKNLRLIAMFDECDDNYKQEENKPYYHARDIAAFRAKLHNSLLVYVSATPSAEMLCSVSEGQTDEIKLTQPLNGTFTPQIKIADKKSEKSRFLSAVLIDELARNLKEKKSSLLIFNRKGYAQAYYCLNCGAYAKCKQCGTILQRETDDNGQSYLHCKKCGTNEPLEQKCPHCNNLIFKTRNGGTQKIVAELAKIFPQAKLLRLDSDSLKTKDGQGFKALAALQTGNADIVVGTRLASGALRGTNVTLVGVLDAEMELNSPDFRASEKYGQMLFELRGHLSGVRNGKLIIQTADKENYDYQSLLAGDYPACAETELLLRKSFLYPPYVQLIKVIIKSKDFNLLQQQTNAVRRLVSDQCREILGPVWCTKKTDTLKKQYLLFKVDSAHYLDVLARLDSFKTDKKTALQISADPYNFF